MNIYWKCAPLFIDAYITNDTEHSSFENELENFKESMKDQAFRFSAETIGRQVLKNGLPEKIDDKFVLVWGFIIVNKHSRSYVVISKTGENDFEIIEYDHNEEWNVT